jgi:hypothetical protein
MSQALYPPLVPTTIPPLGLSDGLEWSGHLTAMEMYHVTVLARSLGPRAQQHHDSSEGGRGGSVKGSFLNLCWLLAISGTHWLIDTSPQSLFSLPMTCSLVHIFVSVFKFLHFIGHQSYWIKPMLNDLSLTWSPAKTICPARVGCWWCIL